MRPMNKEAAGLQGAPLGQAVRYQDHYCPQLLFAVPRQPKRDELGLRAAQPLPFFVKVHSLVCFVFPVTHAFHRH